MLKHTIAFAAVAGLVFALAPAAQSGTMTVGDPLIPAGLGVGDTFHLAFVTTTTTTGESADVGYYNTFVINAANDAGSLVAGKGWTWYAIVSTTAGVNAIDNTQTTGTGYPIYDVNGTKIADDYLDLWDGTIDAELWIQQTGGLYEFGGTGEEVWTGAGPSGGQGPKGSLGADYATYGCANKYWEGSWIANHNFYKTNLRPIYALSEPLLIVADAAAGAIFIVR